MVNDPRYFVTAAGGQLGRLVVAQLAAQEGPKAVAAVVRDPAAAAPLFPQGVTVRFGDYDRPETLDAALSGAERVLLISSNALGSRARQHGNVLQAAKRAGVDRIAYTSVLHADRSNLALAIEHRQTEALIGASGIAFTLLRNGWYNENHAASIMAALQHGAFIGSAGDGRVASAARLDYAKAAAVALVTDTDASVVYELAGDQSYTLGEFTVELSRQSGRAIPYVDLSEADFRAALISAGLTETMAMAIADADAVAGKGGLFDDGRALSRLIGQPTIPIAETIAETLKSSGAKPSANDDQAPRAS